MRKTMLALLSIGALTIVLGIVAYPASGFAGKGVQVATEDLTYKMEQAHNEATELRDEATALRDEATALRDKATRLRDHGQEDKAMDLEAEAMDLESQAHDLLGKAEEILWQADREVRKQHEMMRGAQP
jgi:predicted  nucleic acid-binding Zn-ribbon protein